MPEGGACTATPDSNTGIRNDYRYILVCQGGVWTRAPGSHYKGPVSAYTELPTTGNDVGDVRLTTDTMRLFGWNGSTWVALAVDQDGNLTVPGTVISGKIQLNDIVIAGGACATNGTVARDSSGALLSCQSGIWRGPSRGLSIEGSVTSAGPSVFPASSVHSNTLLASNPANSQITIPLAGSYFITSAQYTCIPGGPSAYAQTEIYVNGISVAKGVSYPNNCASSHASIYKVLAVGDVVTVTCGDNGGRRTSCWMSLVRM